MTIKELRDKLNSVPAEYDDGPVISYGDEGLEISVAYLKEVEIEAGRYIYINRNDGTGLMAFIIY